METIVVGGGCFWCTEAVFRRVKGIVKVTPGYAGGKTIDTTYQQVCTGVTGHAEVVKIEFDPDLISLEEILRVFFETHDPTTKNRQGQDIGTQYRSVILWKDQKQKETSEKFLQKMQAEFSEKIVTETKPLDYFYPAEEYHQHYFDKHPENSYCQVVIRPKLNKVKGLKEYYIEGSFNLEQRPD